MGGGGVSSSLFLRAAGSERRSTQILTPLLWAAPGKGIRSSAFPLVLTGVEEE